MIIAVLVTKINEMGEVKLKRNLVLFFSLLMVLSLALSACSNPAPPPASETAGSSSEESKINKDDYFITVATGPTSG